jgi:hypothetical protein
VLLELEKSKVPERWMLKLGLMHQAQACSSAWSCPLIFLWMPLDQSGQTSFDHVVHQEVAVEGQGQLERLWQIDHQPSVVVKELHQQCSGNGAQ